jgi:hypothetical protein
VEVGVRRYWSQAMMLLLGISLTVGFYEGRHLVKNTAKALTVATAKSPTGKRGRGHREDRLRDEELGEDEEDFLGMAKEKEDDRLGKRRKLGGARAIMMDPDLSKAEKINLLRMRQRQRLLNKSEPLAAPEGALKGLPKEEEEVLDTGLKQPDRAPEGLVP